MDVSNHTVANGLTAPLRKEQEGQSGQDGPALIHQLISLTGLPEPAVQQELDEIFRLSGTDSGALTLEQLREAMLQYLEVLDSAQALEAEPSNLMPLG